MAENLRAQQLLQVVEEHEDLARPLVRSAARLRLAGDGRGDGLLLSGPMLPSALAPGRLDVLPHLMPLRYLVDAVRDACIGSYATAHTLYGALVALGLTALAVTVGTRAFRTAGA